MNRDLYYIDPSLEHLTSQEIIHAMVYIHINPSTAGGTCIFRIYIHVLIIVYITFNIIIKIKYSYILLENVGRAREHSANHWPYLKKSTVLEEVSFDPN